MMSFIGCGINLFFLFLTLLLFFKSNAEKKRIGWFILTGALFFTAKLFRYQPQNIYYQFLPSVSLFFLFLIVSKKINYPLVVLIGLFLIFISSCLATGILSPRFEFKTQETILVNHHIDESIKTHRFAVLYLPYSLTLKPLLFNQLGYVYYWLSNTFYYLSALNFNNIFLVANIIPLIAGMLKVAERPNKKLMIFIFGCFAIVFGVMGFSRPVNETNSLFVIFPLFFYLILIGFKKIKVSYYSLILLLNLYLK